MNTDKKIQAAYDLAADAYADKFVDELQHKPRDIELLQQFASIVGRGQTVLDLGCGPGHTTAHLASLGVNPVGIDLSPQMITKAQTLFPNIDFEVGDFFQLSADDGAVSGILAFYCIVHLRSEQLVEALSEMFRVLRSNGALLLSFHIGNESVFVEDFLDSGAALEFWPHPVADVEAALRSAGFADVEIHERPPYDTEYPTQRCYILARKK